MLQLIAIFVLKGAVPSRRPVILPWKEIFEMFELDWTPTTIEQPVVQVTDNKIQSLELRHSIKH